MLRPRCDSNGAEPGERRCPSPPSMASWEGSAPNGSRGRLSRHAALRRNTQSVLFQNLRRRSLRHIEASAWQGEALRDCGGSVGRSSAITINAQGGEHG